MQYKIFFIIFFWFLSFTFIKLSAQVSYQDSLYRLDSIYFLNASPSNEHKKGNKLICSRVSSYPDNKTAKTNSFQQTSFIKSTYFSKSNLRPTSSDCRDTSGRVFLKNDTAYLWSNQPIKTSDGNYLISGEISTISSNPYFLNSGFLMKLDVHGNVLWQKTYDSINTVLFSYINYYKILELNNQEIILVGSTNNEVTGNDDLLLTKVSSVGDLIWSKTYKSRHWTNGNGSADYFYAQQIQEEAGTDFFYITGPFWTAGAGLVKLSKTNGNIVWSKSYKRGGIFESTFGLHVKSNEIALFTRALDQYNFNSVYINIYKINKSNGDTLSTKTIKSSDPEGIKIDILQPYPLTVLSNKEYALQGSCFGNFEYNWNGNTPLTQAGVVILDSNFNFKKSYCFRNFSESNSNNTKVTVHRDGSGLFSMLNVNSGYTGTIFYTQFKDGAIVNSRKKFFQGIGYPNEFNSIQLPNAGDLIIKVAGDSISQWAKTEFLKIHSSDTASNCIGVKDQETYIYNVNYIPVWHYTDSVRSNAFQESTNKTFTTTNSFPLAKEGGCTSISYCDSLKISSNNPTICLSQTLQLKTKKNKACGSNVLWNYNNAPINSMIPMNDSTFNLTFSASWAGYIYGSIRGCSITTDSIFVNILQAPTNLNIGTDTVICSGTQILLNAHSGYSSYLWQDGSTDSTFLVTTPGTYHVSTNDACGGSFNDTIVITQFSVPPFSIGNDRLKCNQDTVQLNAPNGFINYQWSPNYNISSITQPSVFVNPIIDTTYFIRAEKIPGCFVYDTVKIIVKNSPPISLGNDTTLCQGQNLLLNAGSGFSTYLWSNTSSNSSITINQIGTYSVVATTSFGCKSYDTIRLLSIHPNPTVQLDQNNELCNGASRTLDAGNFTTYLWSNGSINRTININSLGIYYVTVRDNNGCFGSDTTIINQILLSPQNFLPQDTAICQFGTLNIGTNQNFVSYLWNTNQTTSSILIKEPLLYWLKVADGKGCIGIDTIIVKPKQCLKGLYVPSAFTPNNDNVNDFFKPYLFGIVEKYEFIIRNRFGQIVFQTKNINEFWDGLFKGKLQSNGAFVWSCRYKLGGELEKIEKGTVVLVN